MIVGREGKSTQGMSWSRLLLRQGTLSPEGESLGNSGKTHLRFVPPEGEEPGVFIYWLLQSLLEGCFWGAGG